MHSRYTVVAVKYIWCYSGFFCDILSLNVKMCPWLKLYTVPFFVSGQTYKISKGSNYYCSHCSYERVRVLMDACKCACVLYTCVGVCLQAYETDAVHCSALCAGWGRTKLTHCQTLWSPPAPPSCLLFSRKSRWRSHRPSASVPPPSSPPACAPIGSPGRRSIQISYAVIRVTAIHTHSTIIKLRITILN